MYVCVDTETHEHLSVMLPQASFLIAFTEQASEMLVERILLQNRLVNAPCEFL